MSLTVRHLNADSSFLLTFTPPFAPSSHVRNFPGAFNIVVDPWLHGSSCLWHPNFQTSRHTVDPAISTLAQLHDVNIIIITQDKPDHCHKETLCSLPPNTPIKILAVPSAAKKIRKWQHFQRKDAVHVIKRYKRKNSGSVIRIPLDAYSTGSAEGEVTIASIRPKFDVAGVHNAVGITYRPPGTLLQSVKGGNTLNLNDLHMMSGHDSYFTDPSDENPLAGVAMNITPPLPAVDASEMTTKYSRLSRIDSLQPRSHSAASEKSSPVPRQFNFEKVLSVVYTPHGISSAALKPYIDTHLAPLKNALPITALFHCLTVETNPWFMGGRVNNGAPGAVRMLQKVPAKYWVGAHDEPKENGGFSVAWLKTKRYQPDDVEEMLQRNGWGSSGTQLHILGNGEEKRFDA